MDSKLVPIKVSPQLRQALKIMVAKRGLPDYETLVWELVETSGENGDVERLLKEKKRS